MTELERMVGVERTAPALLLQRIRDIEPLAELIYAGEGSWLLGRVAPNDLLAEAGLRKQRAVNVQTASVRAGLEAKRMHLLGRLQQRGFQYTAAFEGEPDGRIVNELRRADYLWKLSSNQYRFDEQFNAVDAGKEAARADLTDPHKAADAWNYWRKLTHSVTRHDNISRPRSGHTRVL